MAYIRSTFIEKEEFYRQLQDVLNNSKYKKNIIVCGDWNGHIGTDRLNYEGIIEGHGVGNRNEDWKRILDFEDWKRILEQC